MKQPNKLKMGLALLLCVTAMVWSCKNEPIDITATRSRFVIDSLRLADSLAAVKAAETRANVVADRAYQHKIDSLDAINQAGGISYAVNVVDGSASSFGRTNATKTLLTGAAVTVSQFGKSETKTTDATGLAVFSGFFRNSINVTITKAGFTSVNYIVATQEDNNTPNGTQHTVGNIVPLYPTTGPNTATISGKLTIQSDLTNKTRETVPDGTTLSVGISAGSLSWTNQGGAIADNNEIVQTFAGYDGSDYLNFNANTFYVGEFELVNIETGVVGSTTAGLYTVTVPAAFDGLPIVFSYSQIAADQKLYEYNTVLGDLTSTYRTLFGPAPLSNLYTNIPLGSAVGVSFDAGTGAAAAAVVTETNGTVAGIDITAGGSGFVVAPVVVLSAPGNGGATATATATVTNGAVTGLTITSPGSGYTTAPTVSFLNGGGALANSVLLDNGTVTGVVILSTGSGYASAPTVTFSAPVDVTGTTATGTATIDSQGRLTGITITNPGSKYSAAPTVGLAGGTPVVAANVSALWSGKSIGNVNLTNGGSEYLSAPTVTIAKPDLTTGTQATAIALYDAATKTVVGIQVTNSGSGYTTANPAVTLTATGSGFTAKTFLSGGTVISANISNTGTTSYLGVPKVTFVGGSGTGATGTAVLSNGKVVAITITNGGSGYGTLTAAPTIVISAGEGAFGYATVTNGVVAGITVTDGGRDWVAAPRVVLTSSVGGGATATATAAGGSVTAVTVTAGGTGYLEGNTPASGTEAFQAPAGPLPTHPGLKYVVDVYYGTGKRQPN